MRSVRIVVRQMAGSVPALVAAGVFGGAACDEPDPPPPVASSGGSTSLAGSASAGSAVIMIGGSGSTVPPNDCDGYTIQLPDAGLPAGPGELCSVTIEPVMNQSAARVTLSASDEELRTSAVGHITLSPELDALVAGVPVLEIVDASEPKLLEAQLSELTPSDGGYTFTVTWPEGARLLAEDQTRVYFRTAFDLTCETGARLVHSTTEVHLCGGFGTVPSTWASPGDDCAVCRIIAELAASPIIPDHQQSALPLGQALRARVVELARVGQSVVLFAENDGGQASSYEWHASGGRVEQIAPDVVIWHLEPGELAASMQVAIIAEAGAAVVSYDFEGGLH